MEKVSKYYLYSFIELLIAPFLGIISLVMCGWLKQAESNPEYSIPFFQDKEQLSRWITIILSIGLVVFCILIAISIVLLMRG